MCNKLTCGLRENTILIIKRSLFLIPIIFFPLVIINNSFFRGIEYITPLCIITVFIAILNFPSLSSSLQQKDLYFEDLKNNISLDRNEREKWQLIYYRIVLFTAPIIAGIVVDFVFFTSEEKFSDGSIVVIIGVVWSILDLYYTLLGWFGDKIINILHYFKEKEKEKNKHLRQKFNLSRQLSQNKTTIIELPSRGSSERSLITKHSLSLNIHNISPLKEIDNNKKELNKKIDNKFDKEFEKEIEKELDYPGFPPSPQRHNLERTIEKDIKIYHIDDDGTLTTIDKTGSLKKISSFSNFRF